jgi:hypothetical protein
MDAMDKINCNLLKIEQQRLNAHEHNLKAHFPYFKARGKKLYNMNKEYGECVIQFKHYFMACIYQGFDIHASNYGLAFKR